MGDKARARSDALRAAWIERYRVAVLNAIAEAADQKSRSLAMAAALAASGRRY